MKKFALTSLVVAAAAVTACQDASAPKSNGFTLSDASVFNSTPAGFSELTSSFSSTGDQGAFMPSFDGRGGPGGGRGGPGADHGGPGFGLGDLMGGGLDGPFLGDGIGGSRFGPQHQNNCAFTANVGVVCTDTTHDGLAVRKTTKYTNAAGTLQSAFDSTTTSSIAVSSSVSGTATRRGGSSSVVSETGNQTVAGLLTASRTVNGAASGTETTTGTNPSGAFTAKRTTADAVTGVVIPKATAANAHPYPTGGKVTRSMTAAVTQGGATTTTTRSETITYDGTATAKVVIVKDGTTQNCTLALPHGHLTCS
jgi:hypothetical protein